MVSPVIVRSAQSFWYGYVNIVNPKSFVIIIQLFNYLFM